MSSLVTPSPSLGPSASGQQDYPSPSSGELRDSSPEVKKPLSPSLEITALDISTTTPETDHLQHGDSLLSPVAPSSAAPDAAHGPPRPRLLESPPAPIEIPLASIAMVTHVTATESPTALSPKEFATLAAIPTGASPRQTSLSLLTRSSSNATTGAGVTKYKMGSVSTESHFPPAHSHSSPRASLLKLFTEESRSASIVGGNLAGAIGKRTSIEEIRPGSTTTTPLPRGAQPSRSSSTASPTTPMPTSLLKDAPSSKRLTWSRSDKEVLIGTPVKEGHSNYILMYDMLTGIRISVSRCTAKVPRALIDRDFTAAHKLAFDVTGTEMTPSSKYDFKFKDYAPWVFRTIRECFHVDHAEYLLSLTGKYVLSELGSPGKSGSFFYFSQDYRFIIKTIHRTEHKFLRRILKNYYEHIKNNPHTLLSRIFGLHRVKLPGNRKIHFVVMGNIFPPNKDIHETYDLKGSMVGRYYPEEKAVQNPRAVLKDKNWLKRDKKINLGPEKRKLLIEQIDRDVKFLIANRIMDYSLLIGIHDTVKGNSSNIRDNTLAVFEPREASHIRRNTFVMTRAEALKEALAESDLVQLGPSSARLPEMSPPERTYCYFYQDFGGFGATDELNLPGQEIFYLGIIDIFTEYNATKKLEHFFKSIGNDPTKISAVKPGLYGSRFLKFMKNAVKGFITTDSTATSTA